MLSVQLSSRNVLMIDMMKDVYSQDKRDDIQMKLEEHKTIQDSDEEKKRYWGLSLVDKKKSDKNTEKELENIKAISYRMLGNGFHSGEVTEMHTCLQRPILLTMSHEDQYIRLWNYEDDKCELE